MENNAESSKKDLETAGCPAFTEGCPYSSEETMVAWLAENRPETLEKCPAFSEGCPFKGAADLDEMKKIIGGMPESHKGAGPQHAQLVNMFKVMGGVTDSVKAQVGSSNECPVFSFQGLLCSDGVPLVDAIEYRSWSTHLLASSSRRSGAPGKDGNGDGEDDDDEESEALPPLSSEGAPAPSAQQQQQGGEGRPRGLSADYRPVTEPVSKLLKEGTKAAHKAAENVHYVREFVHGRVTRDVYRRMVANLYFVYKAMEDAMDANAEHPLIKPVYFPKELHRAAELEKDLAYYFGEDWRELKADTTSSSSSSSSASASSPPSSSASSSASSEGGLLVTPTRVAQAYVARLAELGKSQPELLVPHAYTRYLGDLSGGQVLKRAAIKGMGLTKEAGPGGQQVVRGVRFYDFEHIPTAREMKEFKKMYRAKLDSLNQGNEALMDSQLADLMVAEANYAFELNTALFHELDVMSGFVPADDARAQKKQQGGGGGMSSGSDSADAVLHGYIPNPPDPEEVRKASLATQARLLAEKMAREKQQAQQQQQGGEAAPPSPKDPLAGCPFASLVRATGMPMPANHPGAAGHAAKGSSSSSSSNGDGDELSSEKASSKCPEGSEGAGKCPLRSFGLVDCAIVLIFAALFLLLMPPTAGSANPTSAKITSFLWRLLPASSASPPSPPQ